MHEPIRDMKNRRINSTLHGRSIYRPRDVEGHNVFKGWTTWENNGHRGVGDGIDFCAAAGTEVFACFDGRITEFRNDTSKLEVLYLSDGIRTAVYAHINAAVTKIGTKVKEGQVLGWLLGSLRDPHLHFEYWPDTQRAMAGATPKKLLALMVEAFDPHPLLGYADGPVRVIDQRTAKPAEIKCGAKIEGGVTRCDAELLGKYFGQTLAIKWRSVREVLAEIDPKLKLVDHIPDQRKLYVTY